MASAKAIASQMPSSVNLTSNLALGEPVALLAEHARQVSEAFYSIHQSLLDNKTPTTFISQFKQGKQVFMAECETIKQLIQASSRHATDYTASSQKAPDDRALSARRCFLTAKAIQQQTAEVSRVYGSVVDDFRKQRQPLEQRMRPVKKSKHGTSEKSFEDPANPVNILHSALEGIQLSLKRIKAFWDSHVAFLTLIMTRQTNYPSPGGEARDVLDCWSAYQKLLVQASASLVSSIQVLSQDPVVQAQQKPRPRGRPLRRTYTIDISFPKARVSTSMSSEATLTTRVGFGLQVKNFFKGLLY